jgi:predicted molibdopterin-dependent oxidoreductase YjgC
MMMKSNVNSNISASPDSLKIWINGKSVEVNKGTSVAAALLNKNNLCTRTSVQDQTRFALCGMGICQECRVQINGKAHQLACQTVCEAGMVIQTDSSNKV